LASTLPVKAWEPPSEAWEALYQRLVEHDNVTEMQQMLRYQLHALRQRVQVDPAVVVRKQHLIEELSELLKTITQEIEE
jgi:hypothetical protein